MAAGWNIRPACNAALAQGYGAGLTRLPPESKTGL